MRLEGIEFSIRFGWNYREIVLYTIKMHGRKLFNLFSYIISLVSTIQPSVSLPAKLVTRASQVLPNLVPLEYSIEHLAPTTWHACHKHSSTDFATLPATTGTVEYKLSHRIITSAL